MSLTLDARQRAMLQEMGVRVWLPEPKVGPGAAAADAPPAKAAATLQPEARREAPASATHAPATAQRPAMARAGTPPSIATLKAPADVAPASPGRISAIRQMDWRALQQDVAGCTACGLCKGRKNTVFGVGQAAPVDWLIVGEAPGEMEDIQGEPFVGAAGKLLDNMLKAIGLNRNGERAEGSPRVFIANVLKCRPPGNRNPQPEEIAQCEPYLARQIELLKPRVIVALGRFAVQTLLAPSVPNVQAQPLGKLRGQIYRWRDVPVVVSYHPAYLLRSLPDKAKAWADLCLALQVLADRSPRSIAN